MRRKLLGFLWAGLGAWAGVSCQAPEETVVVYTSQDQVYAERIFQDFERETQIRVRSLFDTESLKTTGLATRLRAESSHPQCDLFWSNEAMLGVWLARQGVLDRSRGWAWIGFRSRRMVIHREKPGKSASGEGLVTLGRGGVAPAPRSLSDLTNAAWHGQIAFAYPLFGTTASQFVALRELWGKARWLAWCRALVANQSKVVDGNSVVVQLVARGEAAIGLTDFDDVAAAVREGSAVEALPLSSESLLIPNTLAIVRGAPHPFAAQRLFDYLQRPDVLKKLVDAGALEGIAPPANSGAGPLVPDWDRLSRAYDAAAEEMRSIFLR